MDSTQNQTEQLKSVIVALEAQRPILGDSTVDAAIALLRNRLVELEAHPNLRPAPDEARRIVTILFSDVVGSTAIAEKLDPEEWRAIIAQLHRVAGDLIDKNRGRVVQYLGDGLLALFGADHPDERDAEDAIRAALEIQKSKFRGPSADLRLRIGIHTGLVVVGELGSVTKREFTATGDGMNLAARLQSAAPPGGIIISHDTYRYVRGIFDVTPQPPLTLKGKRKPVRAYLVRQARARAFHTVERGVLGVDSKTVGREREFNRLQDGYREALERRSLVWTALVGEPGLGKSRLLGDLSNWVDLQDEPVRLLRTWAAPSDANQPYALIRRLWFDCFQMAEDAPLAEAEKKWMDGFNELWGPAAIESDVEERAHVLGLLLGLPFRDSPHIGAMRGDPTQIQGRAFVISRELLARIRIKEPVVMLLEDVHWADAASWDYFLNAVLDPGRPSEGLGAQQGLFVLATARPEWQPPERLRAEQVNYRYIEIVLGSLNDLAMHELVTSLLQRVENMPASLVDVLVSRAEGVPYYAEELVNWFLDRGVIIASQERWHFLPERFKESPLPLTLQHLLLTRLWGLKELERSALQRGAIFGRHFWSGGVEALGVPNSQSVLSPLQPRGLIDQQPESAFEGEQEWSFHHNLMRDVTYESLLKRERAELHDAAAHWLLEQAERAGRSEEFAGLVAEHLDLAGKSGEAAEWYLRAAEQAQSSSALEESRRFFDRALVVLPAGDREGRWRALRGREATLDLRSERELQKADIDALLDMAEEFDDQARRAEAAYRRTGYLMALGEHRAMLQAAEQAIVAARRAGKLELELWAQGQLLFGLIRLGERDAAARSAEAVEGLVRGVSDDAAIGIAMGILALYYGDSGNLSRAVELGNEAIEHSQRAGDRLREALMLSNQAFSYASLGLYKEAQNLLERALQLNQARGDRRLSAYSLNHLGYVALRSADRRTARRLAEEALSEFTMIGDAYGRAETLLLLGYIAEQAGDYEEAGSQLAAASQEFKRLGLNPYRIEALAGQARCALAVGRLKEARQWADEVWIYLQQHGPQGIDSPSKVYVTVAGIFDTLGMTFQSRAAAEAGYAGLMSRAAKISNPEWRKSFLENVEEHHALVEMWGRLGGSVLPLFLPDVPNS